METYTWLALYRLHFLREKKLEEVRYPKKFYELEYNECIRSYPKQYPEILMQATITIEQWYGFVKTLDKLVKRHPLIPAKCRGGGPFFCRCVMPCLLCLGVIGMLFAIYFINVLVRLDAGTQFLMYFVLFVVVVVLAIACILPIVIFFEFIPFAICRRRRQHLLKTMRQLTYAFSIKHMKNTSIELHVSPASFIPSIYVVQADEARNFYVYDEWGRQDSSTH